MPPSSGIGNGYSYRPPRLRRLRATSAELTRHACLLDKPAPALMPSELACNRFAAWQRTTRFMLCKRPLPRLPAHFTPGNWMPRSAAFARRTAW